MSAAVASFSFLNEIHPDKSVLCIVDDSHGMGILGHEGEGISHLLPQMDHIEYALSFSLSKAYHIAGGAVCCTAQMASLLKRSAFYTASTAISPGAAYAFVQGQGLYHRQLQLLKQNVAVFAGMISHIFGVCHHPNLPIFILKRRLTQQLFDPYQVMISSFAYPAVSGEKVNRIVVNALHTTSDLQRVANVLQTVDMRK